MPTQTVLVTAPGGHIGSELVPLLLQHGSRVVLPTSNGGRLHSNLAPSATRDNVAIEEGSIRDPLWVESIINKHRVDAVFLCLTGSDELIITLNFLDAMQRAGTVKHLVYVSAAGDFVSEQGLSEILKVQTAAHVLVKPLIELKLRHGEYSWASTVLGPTLFWDNDVRDKDFMMQEGQFNEVPGDLSVSRVSAEDIATVACNVLAQPVEWDGKKVMIGSKKLYTSTEIARLWSDALGKQLKMCANDEDGFNHYETVFNEKMARTGAAGPESKAWARDHRLMYQGFTLKAFGMSDVEYDLSVKCLGREPRDYAQWVRETGKSWTS